MTLSQYVKRRNGVPMGHNRSLQHNLQRSLGAKNFSAFWNFWNPIFGYYLGTKIFKPLKNILPIGIALVLTFIVCGLVHDVVTTVIRGQLSLFFAVWFLFMGIGVLISKKTDYNLSHKPWIVRSFVNLSIIAICLLTTIYLNTIFNFY